MKTYVLTLSVTFPKWHPRAGEPTNFKEKMANAIYHMRHPEVFEQGEPNNGDEKYHTLRGNYERWKKIFEQIDQGEACLVLKQWSGVPYRSKQETIAVLTKEDGIGLQKLQFKELFPFAEEKRAYELYIDGEIVCKIMPLATNDGLSYEDWLAWMTKAPKADISKPFAIIHFTKFRY